MKNFFTKVLGFLGNISPKTWVMFFVVTSLGFGVLFYISPEEWATLTTKDNQSQVTTSENDSILPEIKRSKIEEKKLVAEKPPPKKKYIPKKLGQPTNHNADLLDLINGGIQEVIHIETASKNEQEDVLENKDWQEVISEYQKVNPPVNATRILPREYIISATLLDKVISQIAGTARFITDTDTYAKSGNNILIPTGSIGLLEYKEGLVAGETRMIMEVIRITTPNNLIIVFSQKPGISDGEGAQGVPGEINNQYAKKYGIPLLFSLINNSTNLLSLYAVRQLFGNPTDPNQSAAVDNFSQNLTTQNSTILNEILKNTINTNPVITIKAGSPITIKPLQDIYFEKPEKGKIYLTIEQTF